MTAAEGIDARARAAAIAGSSGAHPATAAFRAEIAGLRAVAVLAVIIFHAGVEKLSGGFVGVDIFFVISGFLITSIIVRDMDKGQFSLAAFYARRAKRLFAPGFLLVAATVAFGWFLLNPNQYKDLANSAVAALLFASNFYFYANTGYFDQSAEILPLLHLWSLAVEEQFYLFFPAILLLANRFLGRNYFSVVIVLVTIASLASSIAMTYNDAQFAFFMLATRAWQLGLGATVALAAPLSRNRALAGNLLSGLGAALIAAALVLISTGTPYPGWWALLPTLGTAVLIYAAQTDGNLVRAALSLSPLTWVGKISYSAYLWHWPVIVYYRIYISERAFTPSEIGTLILASLVLGWASWRFIEEKVRYARTGAGTTFILAGTVVAAIALPSAIVSSMSGVPSRENPAAIDITDIDRMWNYPCVDAIALPGSGVNTCVIGAKWATAERKGVLWGDSHSEHFAPVFDIWAKQQGIAFVVGPRSCPAFLNGDSSYYHRPDRPKFNDICRTKQAAMIDWLAANPDVSVVVMAAAWSGYAGFLSHRSDEKPLDKNGGAALISDALVELIGKVSRTGRTVVLLGDVPRPQVELNSCAALSLTKLWRADCRFDYKALPVKKVLDFQSLTNKALADAAAATGAKVLLPTDTMCDERACSTIWNGEFIYRDNNHIRRNLKPETLKLLVETIGINTLSADLSR